MDYDTIDWTRPIMFEDGRFCRDAGARAGAGDRWVEYWNGVGWYKAAFSRAGGHICYPGETRLPRVTYQPIVDMQGALWWLDTKERAFIREKFWDDYTCTGYSVDDPSGRLYHVMPDGRVQGIPPRVLGNVPNEQVMTEGRLAIKKAQAERARRREQEALDQLADLNPTVFGSF